MKIKPVIKYPVENTVLFGTSLTIHYSLDVIDPSIHHIVFVLDSGEELHDLNFTGTYTILNIKEGFHKLSGYLVKKNNVKISGTDFVVNFTTNESTYTPAKKLTYVLKSTIPDFVKEDYQNFVLFLKAYYEWMYSSNNPFYAPLLSETYKDLDKTPDFFIKYFREQYLKDFPESLTKDKQTGTPLNIKTLLKNISQFYTAKGTEKSVQFLLKILYDNYSEIYYPKVDIFKASDSIWVKKQSVKFTTSHKNVYEIKNKQIYQKQGIENSFVATIEDIQVYRTGNKQIVELSYVTTSGIEDFNLIFYVDGEDTVINLYPVQVVTSLDIVNGGVNYKLNDKVEVTKINTDDITKTVAYGKVASVNAYGSITSINFVNFGVTEDIVGSYEVIVNSQLGSGAEFAVNEGYICNYPGYWKRKNSHTNSTKHLADNKKYQNLSYVIKTDRSLDRYVDVLKKLAHPAGIEVLGDILHYKDLEEYITFTEEFKLIYTPLLGNYAPYTFNSSLNARDSFHDLFPHGFDPNRPNPLKNENTDTPHIPINKLSENVEDTVFAYLPAVSDINEKNNYWIVYPHPNTEINNNTNLDGFKSIKISDFVRQEIS